MWSHLYLFLRLTLIPMAAARVAAPTPAFEFWGLANRCNDATSANRVRFPIRQKVPSGRASSVVRASADGAELGEVHLGRRVLLGSVITAVALSKIDRRSGLAIAEGTNEEAKSEKVEEAAPPPQVKEENWKNSRVYDATVLGEPLAVSGDRSRVWDKLLQARVVYLGEAERVPDSDDRVTITFNFVIRVLEDHAAN